MGTSKTGVGVSRPGSKEDSPAMVRLSGLGGSSGRLKGMSTLGGHKTEEVGSAKEKEGIHE